MNETKVQSMMKRIAEGSISRGDAAEALNVTVRTVNRWMAKRGVSRPPGIYRCELEGRRLRRETKASVARRVVVGTLTMQNAADEVGVTVRTIERWVKKAEKDAQMAAKVEKHRKNAGKSRKSRSVS